MTLEKVDKLVVFLVKLFWTGVRFSPGPPKGTYMNETELKLRQMYIATAKSIVLFIKARHYGHC